MKGYISLFCNLFPTCHKHLSVAYVFFCDSFTKWSTNIFLYTIIYFSSLCWLGSIFEFFYFKWSRMPALKWFLERGLSLKLPTFSSCRRSRSVTEDPTCLFPITQLSHNFRINMHWLFWENPQVSAVNQRQMLQTQILSISKLNILSPWEKNFQVWRVWVFS